MVTTLHPGESDIYVLIDDSFVLPHCNKLTNVDLFERELRRNVRNSLQSIKENSLVCVRSSLVSKWLKDDKFVINTHDVLDLTCSEENNGKVEGFYPGESHEVHLQTSKDGDVDEQDKKYREGNTTIHVKSHESTTALNIASTSNEHIVKILDLLYRKYLQEGDRYRARGYKTAKRVIQECPFPIESGRQAQTCLPHIGPSLAKKIQTILDSGTLPGIQGKDPTNEDYEYFTHCHGVGHHTARRWTALNYRSFSDVLKNEPESFTTDWCLLFGWSYYEDWSLRISRRECEEHFKVVKTVLADLAPECNVEIMGSYIRGAQSSGDIDLLFYIKDCDDTRRIANILKKLVIRLHSIGYIVCTLQLNSDLYKIFEGILKNRFTTCHLSGLCDGSITFGMEKLIKKYYLGARLPLKTYRKCCDKSIENSTWCKLKPVDEFMSLSKSPNGDNAPCRRLDFFCAKWSEIGAARMQWVGPSEFNRQIRLLAAKKGFKLTQHGLYKEGTLLEAFDERKIFELLGVPYLEPKEREHWIQEPEDESPQGSRSPTQEGPATDTRQTSKKRRL